MATFNILQALESVPLSYSSIREVIQVIHENKIARLSLNDSQILQISKYFDYLGLSYFLSDRKYLSQNDAGKGGFSNSFAGTFGADVPIGDFLVYIGLDPERVAEAKFAEESEDDTLLGEILGYPECCSLAFTKAKAAAAALQNDFTLPILKKNNSELLLDPFSIHLPQYFAYGLFSHFPCSTNCSQTSSMSLDTLDILFQLDKKLANKFRRYQLASYLYTEYDGIYGFFDGTYSKNGFWVYDKKKLEMSASGLLAENLMRGNQIAINSPSNFTILRDGKDIVSIQSETVYLLVQKG